MGRPPLDGKTKSARVQLVIPKSLLKRIDAITDERSVFIRKAIEAELRKRERKR